MIVERLTERHRAYAGSGKPLRWQSRAFFRGLDGDRVAALSLRLREAARHLYRGMKSQG
jgi:hypothetical protein